MKKLSVLVYFILIFSSCTSLNSTIDSILANERLNAFQKRLETRLISGREKRPDSNDTDPDGAELFEKAVVTYPHNPSTAADVSMYRSQGIHPRIKSLSSSYNDAVFKDPEKRLPILAADLMKGVEDPFERVKIIHDWVARNIRYDAASYRSGNIPPQDPFTVVRTRKSVCEGYANLFAYLSDQAGIENVVVHGYARGEGYSVFEIEDITDSNHAWNAVKVGDNWYFLDVTWDSGYLEGSSFIREYSTAYLFIAPEHMIYTHFPDNPRLQLLENPVTADAFGALPYLEGDLFLVIPDFHPPLPLVTDSGDRFELEYPFPADFYLDGQLLDADEKEIPNRVFIQKGPNGMTEIQVAFPQAGKFILRLFAGTDASKPLKCLCEFGFISSRGSQMVFPLQYESFCELPYRLISPVDEPVVAGADNEFSFYLPGISEAFLYDGKNRYTLSDQGDSIFSTPLAVPKEISTLTLTVKKEGSTNDRYEGLLSFPVQR